ncbi:hypothetical protein BC628DRAFT_1112470 [Trametes gibbosa]|nr:hypothetical protein BC628DRAFT_1112470 [Trametes gibbosa]
MTCNPVNDQSQSRCTFSSPRSRLVVRSATAEPPYGILGRRRAPPPPTSDHHKSMSAILHHQTPCVFPWPPRPRATIFLPDSHVPTAPSHIPHVLFPPSYLS